MHPWRPSRLACAGAASSPAARWSSLALVIASRSAPRPQPHRPQPGLWLAGGCWWSGRSGSTAPSRPVTAATMVLARTVGCGVKLIPQRTTTRPSMASAPCGRRSDPRCAHTTASRCPQCWVELSSRALPVGDHGMQHRQRVAIYPGGDRQPAGHQQCVAAPPDGGARARLPKPSEVELVKKLGGLPDIPQRAVGAGAMRWKRKPWSLATSSRRLAAARSGLSALIAATRSRCARGRPRTARTRRSPP